MTVKEWLAFKSRRPGAVNGYAAALALISELEVRLEDAIAERDALLSPPGTIDEAELVATARNAIRARLDEEKPVTPLEERSRSDHPEYLSGTKGDKP